jgi:hypothetical protein
MTTSKQTTAQSDTGVPAPNGSGTPTSPEAIQAENELLRRRVQRLEEEYERAQQAIAALTAERDDYLRAVYAYLKKEFEQEATEEFRVEDYTLSVEDLFAGLESPDGGR